MTLHPFEQGDLVDFPRLLSLIKGLPGGDLILPPARAPSADILQKWLEAHQSLPLPRLYLNILSEYGGADRPFPLVGMGIDPLSSLLAYRQERNAIGEPPSTSNVLLSHGHIEGDLCLVFDEGVPEPRVAFVVDLSWKSYQADSLGMFLWTECVLGTCVSKSKERESLMICGASIPNLARIPGNAHEILARIGVLIAGRDSCRLVGFVDDVSFVSFVRAGGLNIVFGTQKSRSHLRSVVQKVVAAYETCFAIL